MFSLYNTRLFRFVLIALSFILRVDVQRCSTIDYQKDSIQVRTYLKSARENSLKDFPKAVLAAQNALNLALVLKDNKLIFNVYRAQGNINEDNNHLTDAHASYEKALALKDFLPVNVQLDIYLDWAIINKKLSKYDVTRDYYQRALDLAFQANDLEIVQFVYSGLGTLNGAVGAFDKAIDNHLLSKEIAEKRQHTEGVISAYVNISTVYMQSKNYTLAYNSLEKSYNLAVSIKDSMLAAYILNVYGKVLNAEKRYNEAIGYHKKALTYCELLNNKTMIAQTLGLMADVYTKLMQYDNAEKTFKRCFEYSSYFDFYEQPNLYFSMGNLYVKTKRPAEAENAFIKGLNLATKRAFIDLIQKTNRGLVDVYKQLGNSKQALQHMKIAAIYEDSIFNSDKIKQIAEAQYKFDLNKTAAEHKLNIAKSEKELQELHLSQNRIILYLMFVLLGAAFIFLFFYMQQKTMNNLILSQKNIEIQSKNNRLEKANDVLQQFAYASAHDLKEPLRSISGFVSIIDRKYAQLLPEESSSYMTFVVSGVKRMESLIAALLEYSTLASDEEDIKQASPIEQILADVKANLNGIIVEKKAVIEYLGYLPALKISRLHLTQLFQNLIGNAVKFSNEKPLVQIKGLIEKGQYIIEIKDNGIGMEAEYSDKIFHLFQRLSRSVEGTGIGLAICKEIVNKYDGTIRFDSVKNVGTTFILSFPEQLSCYFT